MNKKIYFGTAGLIILIVVLWWGMFRAPCARPCLVTPVQSIYLEIADTAEEQKLGLSFRDLLPDQTGMLFIFDEPNIPNFWMKDMKFAIDIVWIDQGGVVVDVTKNAQPESYPELFSPPRPIRYALELPAGNSERFGLEKGVSVSLFLLP